MVSLAGLDKWLNENFSNVAHGVLGILRFVIHIFVTGIGYVIGEVRK